MMVITKKQLKKFNESFCDAKLSADGEKVLIEVMRILGLRETKVDGLKRIVPASKNEMYWSHARDCVKYLISDFQTRIALHDEEIEEMESGIKKNDENRRLKLYSANKHCLEAIKSEWRYLKNIEED